MEWIADKALVFGGSGLVGGYLVDLLVASKEYKEVILFSRKASEHPSPKVKVVNFDFNSWEGVEQYFTPNAIVFCCIGSTKAKTPNLDEYRDVDFGIPVKIAEFAARGSCRGMLVVSALGANDGSMNFYLKTKGEMEKEVHLKGIRETYFFRPALLLGERNEQRTGEDFGKMVNAVVSPLLFGPFKKYKGIEGLVVAKAMIRVAQTGYYQPVIESDKIFELGNA
jgi:uncharacterized protein YbjT (DUF2867 family)